MDIQQDSDDSSGYNDEMLLVMVRACVTLMFSNLLQDDKHRSHLSNKHQINNILFQLSFMFFLN